MNNTTPFIVTETPNGSGFARKAFICYGEADLIGRVSEMARRSGEDIDTVQQALDYLDDRYAQRTRIVTQADFDALTIDSWDTPVLLKAQDLGWYTPADEDEEDDE